MWRAAVAVLLVAAAVASTACSPKSPASGEWTLLTLDGAPLFAGTEIRLDLGDSDYSSFDGCNTLRGRSARTGLIAQPDGTFWISGDVFRTEIDCVSRPGVMEQAGRYLQALNGKNRYDIVEGRLEITDYRGDVRLVFLKRE